MHQRIGTPGLPSAWVQRDVARKLFNVAVLCLLTWAAAPSSVVAQSLPVEVQESRVVNDGVAAISLRTFRSRPVSQGQLCLRALDATAASPLFAINSSTVFSSNNDANATAELVFNGPVAEAVMVTFDSPTQSIMRSAPVLLIITSRPAPP